MCYWQDQQTMPASCLRQENYISLSGVYYLKKKKILIRLSHPTLCWPEIDMSFCVVVDFSACVYYVVCNSTPRKELLKPSQRHNL